MKICGPKSAEKAAQNYILGSFTVCTLRQVILGWSNRWEWSGRGTWQVGMGEIEKCFQGFGEAMWRKDTPWKTWAWSGRKHYNRSYKMKGWRRLDAPDSLWGQESWSCERRSETSGSIKCGEFPQIETYSVLQEESETDIYLTIRLIHW